MTLRIALLAPRRGLAAAGALGFLALATGCDRAPEPPATYVGRTACASCHAAQDSLWRGSHHALAMQVADSTTVLGDFDNASFTYNGVTTRFVQREGRYWVATDGPDGTVTEYPVEYTFGVYPLQQYLVPFPRGRYQALGIAWDARPKSSGGQRWFHLYPDERVDHRDLLHWTGQLQNWNFMCAQCHSTNLQKGYVAAADSYATTWSEIDVSCEACHGPGSRHVELARGASDAWAGSTGLTVNFRDGTPASWTMDSASGIAHRSAPRGNRMEVETCGLCHARRAQVWPDSAPGRILAQTQRVTVLDAGLYFPDGQQQDEVYEYGSFLQSKMYRAGVTCSDCHDPHQSTPRASGNALCAACHLPAKFDVEAHTHHAAGTPGAQCVACHMPTRNYMVVDARRDHGMKVPRPGLSAELGTPSACTACHADKPTAWAAEASARWYGPPDSVGAASWARAIAGGRRGAPGAGQALVALTRDTTAPSITRATAVTLIPANPTSYAVSAIQLALADRDPLIRRSAAEQVESVDPSLRPAMALPLLSDSVRTVRLAALPALVGLPDSAWSTDDRAAYARVLAEYRASQAYNADRPESWANLGNLDARLGNLPAAEASYRRALALQPQFVAAYLQLAELYRVAGREAGVDSVLRMGLDRVPGHPDLEYQLGLALVRQGRKAEALQPLKLAAASGTPRYGYAYGVALYDAGQGGAAVAQLQRALAAAPDDQEVLYAIASIGAAVGQRSVALKAARRLAELNPGNEQVAQLVAQLEGAGARP